MINAIVKSRLSETDDPGLWDAVLDTVFMDIETGDIELDLRRPGTRLEIGACSHWLRPNQFRWTAAGGFAAPEGYGSGGLSRKMTTELDWSVQLEWDGEKWVESEQSSKKVALQVVVPSKSRKHPQAAIKVTVQTGKENYKIYYGFRRNEAEWTCVAVQDIGKQKGVKQ